MDIESMDLDDLIKAEAELRDSLDPYEQMDLEEIREAITEKIAGGYNAERLDAR